MSKQTQTENQKGRASSGKDAYQLITDRIVELLETGVVPWYKPWVGGKPAQNLKSGKAYRGINVFLLGCAPYSSPYWVTYKQAQDLGGKVKKGAKGYPVVFWKWNVKCDSDDDTERRIPVLRRYTVFNAFEQCEELDVPDVARLDSQWNPIQEAEKIAAGYEDGPQLTYGGFQASYNPVHDRVQMPERLMFDHPEEFYCTLFHELGHSSGHSKRLNRSGVTEPLRFGSHAYSKEELCAEMAAAFLCGEAGIVQHTIDNSAAYINGWLERLKSDKRFVVQAAAQAQKAADLILGREVLPQ